MSSEKAAQPRILIVDDDPGVRDGLSRALMIQGGFEVSVAEDGFDAGFKLARNQPHLVILDVVMRGMGGFDICSRIRRLNRSDQVKIIVLTGFAGDDTAASSLVSGADLLLTKPCDAETLLLHIEELLTD